MSGMKLAFARGVVALLFVGCVGAKAETRVERGKYLVTLAGCSDCHTPGTFLGKPDMGKFLGGSDVGFFMPGLGIFPGRNLTPDPETGLGKWTDDQILAAITTGVRPDGRKLAPIMPVEALSKLTKDDAQAVVAFLRSIPAVKNAVPGPFGPKEKPSVFVFTVLPPDQFVNVPQ